MTNFVSQIRRWPQGIRFYIGLTTVLVTAEMYWYTKSVYGDSNTAAIRLQDIYAWLSLSLILLALAIGPLCSLLPNIRGKSLLRDARRLIGVSAAWFAAWHVGISYINQFKAANPLTLPAAYQRAFAVGAVAMLILLALAGTSFDAAFKRLGVWWFRLHRLIYLSVLLILFHAFAIGVRSVSWPYIGTLTLVIGLLFAAHLYLGFGPGKEPTILRSIVLCYGLLITIAVFAYGYSQHLGLSDIAGNSQGGQYESR
ncbi:MAG: ferric reductase-like transmembrane domain-containing protein [Patescibacteria group bacterium]|nr:ferric reductase-like transmembrane domain-containing protein [Patescibacteria group bacterium]